MDDLVYISKQGEPLLKIHPYALDQHERLGWTLASAEVAEKAEKDAKKKEAAEKVAADKAAADSAAAEKKLAAEKAEAERLEKEKGSKA